MLSSFLEWARRLETGIGGNGVDVCVIEGLSSDNPSARVDIDTPTAIARITCWESGDYHAEVIDLEMEVTRYSHHGKLQNSFPLEEEFSPFFEAISE